MALAAEYLGSLWGGKRSAADLVPKFRPADPEAERIRVMAWFDTLAGANEQ